MKLLPMARAASFRPRKGVYEVLAVRVFMVFNSIGITPEKLECPSWSGAVADILDARNETTVPGMVTGYDRWHFLKVQRN
ncbi:hypothetical protein D3C85_1576240 [compost metagenome]